MIALERSQKERATYSIDPGLMKELARSVPKSKRSAFVEEAIEAALQQLKRRNAVAAIRSFKPYPLKGPDSVETLREIRQSRGDQLVARHESMTK